MAQTEYQKQLISIRVQKATDELIQQYADLFQTQTDIKLSKPKAIEKALKTAIKEIQQNIKDSDNDNRV